MATVVPYKNLDVIDTKPSGVNVEEMNKIKKITEDLMGMGPNFLEFALPMIEFILQHGKEHQKEMYDYLFEKIHTLLPVFIQRNFTKKSIFIEMVDIILGGETIVDYEKIYATFLLTISPEELLQFMKFEKVKEGEAKILLMKRIYEMSLLTNRKLDLTIKKVLLMKIKPNSSEQPTNVEKSTLSLLSSSPSGSSYADRASKTPPNKEIPKSPKKFTKVPSSRGSPSIYEKLGPFPNIDLNELHVFDISVTYCVETLGKDMKETQHNFIGKEMQILFIWFLKHKLAKITQGDQTINTLEEIKENNIPVVVEFLQDFIKWLMKRDNHDNFMHDCRNESKLYHKKYPSDSSLAMSIGYILHWRFCKLD